MDALSTLLMVIIFVLLVFVLAQAFLSVALTGRDKQLDRVNRQLAEVSDMLSLERGRGADLQQSITQLNRELTATGAARDTLSQQLAALKEQAERTGADRDALRAERDRLSQQLVDAGLQVQSSAARLAEMQKQAAELDKTVKADKETISARLSDLAKLAEQNRALAALRDELEKQAQDAAARAMTEQQRRAAVEAQLSGEKSLGDSARAQLALLNRQVDELKAQLTIVAHALELTQTDVREKDTQIANLGQKLNVALASKVEELQRYRSDFFGKLRTVLANRPGIQIVGDRFVFQSEVLFPVGQCRADTGRPGRHHRTGDHHQGHRQGDPAGRSLDHADRRSHRPPADQARLSLRVQLGAVHGACHLGGEAADRLRGAGRSSRGDRVRRQRTARSRGHAGRLREEPAHRTATDRQVAITISRPMR